MEQAPKKSGLWERFLDWIRSLFFNKELELTILGLQNAGKSTFVNVLATGQFDEDTIPTIGFNFRKLKKGKVEFKMWDLGGQARFRDSWEKYCRTCNVIIYVVDSNDRGNIDLAKIELHNLLQWPSVEGVPVLVLGNKNDIPDAMDKDNLIQAMDLKSIKNREVAFYSISCKNLNNIDNVLKWLNDVKGRK